MPEPGSKCVPLTVVHNLTVALRAYRTEYGKWPDFADDGLFLDEKRQAQLLRVLCAKDETNNERKIPFFEGRTARKTSGIVEIKQPYRNGFSPETGAYLDPLGRPYQIALDTDGDGQIASPYPDDPPIAASVIVWSLGKDGKKGAHGNPRTAAGSDDIRSWP